MHRNKDPRSQRQINDFLNDTNANTAESTLKTNKCFDCGLWWGNIYMMWAHFLSHLSTIYLLRSSPCLPPPIPSAIHGASLQASLMGLTWEVDGEVCNWTGRKWVRTPHQGKWANISHPYFNFHPAFMLNVSLIKLSVNCFILSAFQFSLWPVYHYYSYWYSSA